MITIGNGCGFWGDDTEAPLRLAPHVDVMTLDYLSELSLSVLANQQEKDPSLGYARDCFEVIQSLLPFFQQKKFLIVTNGGGFNPIGLAKKVKEIAPHLKIAAIIGDDVRQQVEKKDLYTANAYLGARTMAKAIREKADIVISGRVADPSMTLAPLIAHYGWNDLDKLAQGTLAGHLIECGAQVTGGLREDWVDLPDLAHLGFPIVEVAEDGSFILTKPEKTGGIVDKVSVGLQMVYEVGNPAKYLSPDVTADFSQVELTELGKNRVEVRGAKGLKAPSTLKVVGTYKAGFEAKGTLAFYGGNVRKKGEKVAEILLERLKNYTFDKVDVSLMGYGAVGPLKENPQHLRETLLRIAVRSQTIEPLQAFAKAFAPFVTGGPQGTTGYTNPRGEIRPLFGFWSGLIERNLVKEEIVWI